MKTRHTFIVDRMNVDAAGFVTLVRWRRADLHKTGSAAPYQVVGSSAVLHALEHGDSVQVVAQRAHRSCEPAGSLVVTRDATGHARVVHLPDATRRRPWPMAHFATRNHEPVHTVA